MERKQEIEQKLAALRKELVHHKTKSDSLKITNNGAFGKTSSKYSLLYSPR